MIDYPSSIILWMLERLSGVSDSIKGYQRHRPVIDNLLVAGFLALGVFRIWNVSGLFGMEWHIVLALTVLALGVQQRAWGYYAAVAAILIPLWNLSPYLMTLFVAATLLPRQWWIDRLPLVLLAASAPLLAEWHILGLAPLIAGLVGGPAAGFGVGVGSAIWMKLVAGLAEIPAELGYLHGVRVTWAAIAVHTQEASSLEILRMVVAPFIAGSSALLLHLLQSVGWGAAGWLVGKVRRLHWVKGEPRFLFVPALATGALVLWIAIFMVPAWLGIQSAWLFLSASRVTAGIALASIATAFVTTILERTRRPVVQRVPRPAYTRRRTREGMVLIPTNPEADVVTTTGRWRNPTPLPPEADDEGVIMLEID
jgi:hypothetical protein